MDNTALTNSYISTEYRILSNESRRMGSNLSRAGSQRLRQVEAYLLVGLVIVRIDALAAAETRLGIFDVSTINLPLLAILCVDIG